MLVDISLYVLKKRIEEKGINIVYVTLHVGLGTFRPVNVENINEHKMHSEYYIMSKESANILNETKKIKITPVFFIFTPHFIIITYFF